MADEVSSTDTTDAREREYARRDALQEKILRSAYQRGLHRAYVEAALRRTGHDVLDSQPSEERAARRRVDNERPPGNPTWDRATGD